MANPSNPFKAKFANDAVVISWQSGAFGDDIIVTRGMRVRGDHPAVRTHPEWFVADGTPESEWPGLFDSFNAFSEKLAAEHAAEQERKYPTIPESEVVICITEFTVGFTRVSAGSRHRRTDPIVQKAPQFFSEPPRPLTETTLRAQRGGGA